MKKAAILMSLVALAGCGSQGRLFPDIETREVLNHEPPPAAIRQPVVPEMLVSCRGHVLVPALGMILVLKGHPLPEQGQYLKEENLTPPYRILPPGSRLSQE